MNAEILTVGTELLLGQIVDTNAAFVAERLAEAGIDVYCKTTVGDNAARIEAALRQALGRAQVVLCTGGLGPTEDDLTRDVVAAVTGRPLRLDPAVLAQIQARFARRGIPMPKSNERQAQVPEGAEVLENPRGTAPGLLLRLPPDRTVILVPGVPAEMRPMVTEMVLPRLREAYGLRGRIRSRVLRTVGVSESRVNELLGDLWEERNPTIALLARSGEIHVRITAKAETEEELARLLDAREAQVRERLGDILFGRDEEGLEVVVGRLLTERGLSLAVAESCTGGLLAHRITNVPGSSAYFERGAVTYSNRAKTALLGVPDELIAAKGAVSAEVAAAMAEGMRERAGTDLAVAVTGIAGPGGGTAEKPVGLTYVALAHASGVEAHEFRFFTDRDLNKQRAAQTALDLVRRHLLGLPPPPLR
ncbi:MAG: competence/damage-inducible protein A [candidate division NC10 bacterium]|nr:competence/damage-inducible protein A [candidate division NC10 bacterium]